MLSGTSRVLTYIVAILYVILGAALFLLPGRLAPAFAWKVTPFMTMTIGGWCLGNAWLAWIVARRWTWQLIYPSVFYLWLFGAGELMVVYAFRDKLILIHPIAWLYLITLVVNALTALVGLIDWLRIRPTTEAAEKQTNANLRAAIIFFIFFVGFLGIYGSTVRIGAPGTNAGIFPEIMSQFTLRSFGVFYLALTLPIMALLWDRTLNTFLTHSFASYGLILFITLAALVNIRLFDFIARPGGLAYFAAYLVVGIILFFEFRKSGTGSAP